MASMKNACPNPRPDKYIVHELINSGSFSHVYRVIEKRTKKNFAMKCFKMKVTNLNHFKYAAREIAYLRLLNHDNILQMDSYEVQGQFIYMTVEYSSMGNLRDYLKKNARVICEPIVRNVMRQLSSALVYLHGFGICHGDVKPENIIVTQEIGPHIKLGDFGLADIYHSDLETPAIKAGSLYYMAPEINLGFPFNCTSDLYSSGVIMYEMLFGRKPFFMNNKDKYLTLLRQRTPPDFPEDEARRYSHECLDLTRSLLSYDKQNRYSGANLMNHPFLMASVTNTNAGFLYDEACRAIISAIAEGNRGNHGNALVDATAGVILLKLHYNRVEDYNLKKYVKERWEEYMKYCNRLEDALMNPFDANINCFKQANDEVLRSSLSSTPVLANGYDIGCAGEMYYKEGKILKGIALLTQSVEILLTALKNEPQGTRKKNLSIQIEKWILLIESHKDTGEAAHPQEKTVPPY